MLSCLLSGCDQGIGRGAATVDGERLSITEGEGGLTTDVMLEVESQGGSRVGAGAGPLV